MAKNLTESEYAEGLQFTLAQEQGATTIRCLLRRQLHLHPIPLCLELRSIQSNLDNVTLVNRTP